MTQRSSSTEDQTIIDLWLREREAIIVHLNERRVSLASSTRLTEELMNVALDRMLLHFRLLLEVIQHIEDMIGRTQPVGSLFRELDDRLLAHLRARLDNQEPRQEEQPVDARIIRQRERRQHRRQRQEKHQARQALEHIHCKHFSQRKHQNYR